MQHVANARPSSKMLLLLLPPLLFLPTFVRQAARRADRVQEQQAGPADCKLFSTLHQPDAAATAASITAAAAGRFLQSDFDAELPA